MGSCDSTCWLCLQSAEESGDALHAPCACPRLAHRGCLARWQLTRCGKAEERECRFCERELPDWRQASAALPIATPTMVVHHEGRSFSLCVAPGAAGRAEFERQIREVRGWGGRATRRQTHAHAHACARSGV